MGERFQDGGTGLQTLAFPRVNLNPPPPQTVPYGSSEGGCWASALPPTAPTVTVRFGCPLTPASGADTADQQSGGVGGGGHTREWG